MSELLNTLTSSLQNEFLSGGLVLMLAGSLIALCRRLPFHLWNFLLRRVTIVVDVSNDDPLFDWLSLWLAEHSYSKRARSLTATTERDTYGRIIGGAVKEELPQVLVTPAPGNHLLWYKRRLVWLNRERKEAAPGKEDSLVNSWKREVFTLRILGRSQDAARDLLESAREIARTRRQSKVEVFRAGYDYWERIDERDPRPLSSVFLPAGCSETVQGDIERFLESEAWYAEHGIPWRRGYLFHGLPRSGKTSLISALAGYFRMNLYILNLGNPYLNDDRLMSLLAKVPSRSFLVIEDVDAGWVQRTKSEETKNTLTLSGLLNALDGVGTKQGSLVFMTTNHIERLDPALIGAGRVDLRVEFAHATADQANRMFCAFFPEAGGADGFGDKVESLKWSMADVQNHLIEHRESPVRALNVVVSKERAA